MGDINKPQPYNPDYKSNIPVAYPTTHSHNTYARLEDDEQIARNLDSTLNHRNTTNNDTNDFTEIPIREQIVIVDNRNVDDGALVTGCLVGSLAGIMCCTIL